MTLNLTTCNGKRSFDRLRILTLIFRDRNQHSYSGLFSELGARHNQRIMEVPTWSVAYSTIASSQTGEPAERDQWEDSRTPAKRGAVKWTDENSWERLLRA